MMIRTLIVDDDPNAIRHLKQQLDLFPFIEVIGEVNGGREALVFLGRDKPDLLFLDIEMGDITGLELARHIQSAHRDLPIIFVTGHSGFALEGYEYHPVDFLIKPVDFFRLEKALRTVRERLEKQTSREVPDRKIGVKADGGIRLVNVKDIRFIEKDGRKIAIVLHTGESFHTGDSMKNIEDMFGPYGFYRAHQSFIVPLHRIESIRPDSLTRSYTIRLDDGSELPLSRNKFQELKELLEKQGITII
ncbi:LytR/AlgR family response regulator transcription factor [Bhargavaea ullalensis]|uniref:DNA-binding LytR/AlgR family response regulator n=1 Tax=Bhargavaea ullalensis TaxID=1265685 RepID=A0ABV2G7B8_9BACL